MAENKSQGVEDLEEKLRRVTRERDLYAQALVETTESFEEKIYELSLARKLGDILLNSQGINQICEAILDVIMDEVFPDNCSIMFLDPESGEFHLKAARGKEENFTRLFEGVKNPLPLKVGNGIAGWVALNKRSVLALDTRLDERFMPDNDATRKVGSLLCLPLVIQGQIIGVLNLSRSERDSFKANDERIMTIIVNTSALAIENARLFEEVLRSERMTAIGTMASNLSHDLKSSMQVIRGFADILMKDDFSLEQKQKLFQIINREIGKFVEMTEEITEFAQGGETKLRLEKMLASELIHQVSGFLQTFVNQRNLDFRVEMGKDERISVDPNKFERVFFNLVRNASDAMEPGGRLTLRMGREGDRMVFQVEDTGRGIPPDKIGIIFKPFVTFGKKMGTGLGLAISKKIVNVHGGTIVVNSVEGKGTTFTISLPLLK